MALFSKLPSGGGLSKTKVITTYDIKKTAAYGDMIDELITDYGGRPKGAIYHEEYDTYTKLYVLGYSSNKFQIKTFTIDSTGISEGESVVISGADVNSNFALKGDKHSNVIVMYVSNTSSSTIYCINKETLAVTTISSPTYNNTRLSFGGASIRDGIIYAGISCNLMQPCVYKYDESGSIIGYIENKCNILYCNTAPQLDADGNIYITCTGNGTSSTTIASLTNDGEVRWYKSMDDLRITESLMLLAVADDGSVLCKPRTTMTALFRLDSNGNTIGQSNFFTTIGVSTFAVKYLNNLGLVQIQDIDGKYCYLCDSDFSKLESFTITNTDGIPVVAFLADKIAVVRFDGTLRVETRKPYVEYLKR